MQNHSGYDTGLLPADKQMHLNIDTTDLGSPRPSRTARSPMSTSMSRALSSPTRRCVTSSTPLSKLDRKVVVVFWG